MDNEIKATRGAEKESVLTKISDMMDYSEPFLDKFPRPEKSYCGLATKIRHCMQSMAERAMDTQKCYYPKSVLKELNELDKQIMYAKFYVKRAHTKGYLNFHRFEVVSDYLTQVGKMTGTWIAKVKESDKSLIYKYGMTNDVERIPKKRTMKRSCLSTCRNIEVLQTAEK